MNWFQKTCQIIPFRPHKLRQDLENLKREIDKAIFVFEKWRKAQNRWDKIKKLPSTLERQLYEKEARLEAWKWANEWANFDEGVRRFVQDIFV